MKYLTVIDFFSSAHFYHQPTWTEEKNKHEFGLCYSQFGHGHNYKVLVTVQFFDELSKKEELKFKVRQVCDQFEHKHMNFELPEFKSLIPTTENIAAVFEKKLSALSVSCQKITIEESDFIAAEFYR
jgi:6-pyruvoyltetrahydropterin/6-carboxytetrahydropterin synthase